MTEVRSASEIIDVSLGKKPKISVSIIKLFVYLILLFQ